MSLGLPAAPVTSDAWDMIKEEKRPIVVYGMGNGADKLLDRLESMGVTVADIFASDGFVRGHSFRGYLVKSFSEIKATYPDFLILLSFASHKRDVLDMLYAIDGEYDMLLPDMPVADVREYFDKEFYNAHYEEIKRAYNALSDDTSRRIFEGVVRYKLTGRIYYLRSAFNSLDERYSTMPRENIKTALDLGAYNGDTMREMLEYFPHLENITPVEPDPKTFKRLLKYLDTVEGISASPINAAVWSSEEGAIFSASGNRNSTLTATASYQHKVSEVPLITVDSLGLVPDYIKYDVEGAEMEALRGSAETIEKARPTLLVSLYHRSRDIFEIVNYLLDNYPDYKFYLRRLECLPAWEIDLILTK